ncbi:enhancer of polycomb homolog 1 [Prorops nasuta]|uniref:enhancer of polycomb homolog 1 n=1 Tax=Prorops nasuta TaxID=863751 RepID=UPI0034CEDAAD
MSKLSFRPRPLEVSKPMPIYMAEELPDLPEYSAINRVVPQMPTGMEKEEESEHHLQRAICAGIIIPTPEVSDLADVEAYDKIYPDNYKLPRQLIHMQPFAMEQDIPDYDMDSEDERWVALQSSKMDLTPLQFEEMMDRLEKSSGQTVVTLNEAKALLNKDDDLIIAVFDYWLNKRLKTQHPLLLTVKTEHRLGPTANNPYLAFRRRTEKMQTRRNRKNDETSYEKMLKLRRDLSRAVTLLELVKRREKTKREHLHLTIEVYEKRYQAQDFNGQILSEVSALKTLRPAFTPLFPNHFGVHQNWTNKTCSKDEVVPRKEKRQYKKRKHKTDSRSGNLEDSGIRGSTGSVGGRGSCPGVLGSGLDPLASSDEDSPLPSHSHSQPSISSDRDDEDTADEGEFTFRRSRDTTYLPPVSGGFGNWPWCDRNEGGLADKKYRFALTSISRPTPRCIGLARRRMGRGGRVLLDRCSTPDMDDMWSSLDFTIHESKHEVSDISMTGSTTVTPTTTVTTTIPTTPVKKEWLHFRPKTPPTPASPSCPSSDSDSDSDNSVATSQPSKLPYPFPPEATSICVEIESERPGSDSPPFTSEFNISDYFNPDSFSDALPSCAVDLERTDDIGSSRFSVSALSSSRNSQFSAGLSSSAAIGQCIDTPSNQKRILDADKHRQLNNSASILSKSLMSPTNNRKSAGIRVFSTAGTTGQMQNCGQTHQNGPVGLGNSAGSIVNSQNIVLPQKHPPSNLLPGLIAQTKFASPTRQQQQTQPQQVPTSGEITLNSNSESMDMEVDGVESSGCDSRTQQQQLVRTNKTNALAMEVT